MLISLSFGFQATSPITKIFEIFSDGLIIAAAIPLGMQINLDCDESISDKLLNSLSKSGKNSLKRKITLLEDADPRMIEKSRKIIGESILMITEVEEWK